MVLDWVYEDSELWAHTRRTQHLLWLIIDGSAILKMDIGFYVGVLWWALFPYVGSLPELSM